MALPTFRLRSLPLGMLFATVAACASSPDGSGKPGGHEGTPAPLGADTPDEEPAWEPLDLSWNEGETWFKAYGDQAEWREIVLAARPQLSSCFARYAQAIDGCRRAPTPVATKARVHFRSWQWQPSASFLEREGLHAKVEVVPDLRDPGCADDYVEADIAGAFDSCVSYAVGDVVEGEVPQPGMTMLFSNVEPTMGGLGDAPPAER